MSPLDGYLVAATCLGVIALEIRRKRYTRKQVLRATLEGIGWFLFSCVLAWPTAMAIMLALSAWPVILVGTLFLAVIVVVFRIFQAITVARYRSRERAAFEAMGRLWWSERFRR